MNKKIKKLFLLSFVLFSVGYAAQPPVPPPISLHTVIDQNDPEAVRQALHQLYIQPGPHSIKVLRLYELDAQGDTPLHHAVRLLLQKQQAARRVVHNIRHASVFSHALQDRYIQAMRALDNAKEIVTLLLLDQGIDYKVPNQRQEKIWHYALTNITNDDPQPIEFLLNLIRLRDPAFNVVADEHPISGMNIVDLAVSRNLPNILTLLAKQYNANLLRRGLGGWTILHFAVSNGALDIINALMNILSPVQRKQMIALQTNDGQTVFDIAKQTRQSAIARGDRETEEKMNTIIDILTFYMLN